MQAAPTALAIRDRRGHTGIKIVPNVAALYIVDHLLPKLGLQVPMVATLSLVDATLQTARAPAKVYSDKEVMLTLKWETDALQTLPPLQSEFTHRFVLTPDPSYNSGLFSGVGKQRIIYESFGLYPKPQAVQALKILQTLRPAANIMDIVYRDGQYISDYIDHVSVELPCTGKACVVSFITKQVGTSNYGENTFKMLACDLSQNVDLIRDLLTAIAKTLPLAVVKPQTSDNKELTRDVNTWKEYSNELAEEIKLRTGISEKTAKKKVCLNEIKRLFEENVATFAPIRTYNSDVVILECCIEDKGTEYTYFYDSVIIAVTDYDTKVNVRVKGVNIL